MANYSEIIDQTLKDLGRIKVELNEIQESILANAQAFRQNFGVSSANVKQINDLLKENAKLIDKNTKLKAAQTDLIKKQELAEERLISAKLNNAKKEADILNKNETLQGKKLLNAQRELNLENKKNTIADRAARKAQKEQKLLVDSARAYNRLDGELKKVSKDYQNLAAKRALGEKLTVQELGQLNKLQARLKVLGQAYKSVNNDLIRASGGVNRASTSFDSLGFSIAQITRESPAFLNSLNTGFMAISNNIPQLVDEIRKLQLANKALIAQGQPQINILKRVGSAFFGWQSLVSAGILALTVFAPKIIRFIADMGKAEEVIISTNSALEQFGDTIKSEIGDLVRLTQRIQDVNISESERLGILTELNEKFPEFNTNILAERDNTELVNEAIDEYIQIKVKQIKARELEKKIVDDMIKLEQQEIKNQEKLTELEKEQNIVDTERLKRASELLAMDLRRPKLTSDNAAEVNKILKLEKERDDILKFLTVSQRAYVDELTKELKAGQAITKMKSELNKLLGQEEELVEGSVEFYEKLIAANNEIIKQEKTIRDLDEVRRLQAENDEYQRQIDIILDNEKTKKETRRKSKKDQTDATLELLKLNASANKSLVEDDERSFKDRTELLDQLVIRRRLINEKILANDLKAAGDNLDLQRVARAKYLSRLEQDLEEERRLRKSIQKDILDDIQANLKAISDAQKRNLDKAKAEANGNAEEIEKAEREHKKALLEIQSSYISDVLKNNTDLTEEQLQILSDLLVKMDIQLAKFATNSKNNLEFFQSLFKDTFKTVTDTFSQAFGFDASKFNFVFDELAKDFDNLESTSSELFSVDRIGDWADAAKELIGSVLDANLQRFDNEINAARRARDIILNEETATEEQRESARRTFEEKERRIKTERAKQERENMLIQIGIDTAVGVAKATAAYLSNPLTAPALGLILPIIIGTGAAQAAFVASQPLPRFETGTMNAPEGWAYTQERVPEPIFSKTGELKSWGSSAGASLTYLERGDKVFTSRGAALAAMTAGSVDSSVLMMNAYSNGKALEPVEADNVLEMYARRLEKSNEKTMRQLHSIAKRPINVHNTVEVVEKRAY